MTEIERLMIVLEKVPYGLMEINIFTAERKLDLFVAHNAEMIRDKSLIIDREDLLKLLEAQIQVIESMRCELLSIWDEYASLKNKYVQLTPEKMMADINNSLRHAGYEYQMIKIQP